MNGSYLIPKSMCYWIPNPKFPVIILIYTSVWEVGFSQLSVLDLESSLKNFISFVTSDGYMNGHLFVSFNTERSDGESSSWGNGFLSGQIFQDFWGWDIWSNVPLVSLSPDYPTLILRTNFSILISRMGFSFSTLVAIVFLWILKIRIKLKIQD